MSNHEQTQKINLFSKNMRSNFFCTKLNKFRWNYRHTKWQLRLLVVPCFTTTITTTSATGLLQGICNQAVATTVQAVTAAAVLRIPAWHRPGKLPDTDPFITTIHNSQAVLCMEPNQGRQWRFRRHKEASTPPVNTCTSRPPPYWRLSTPRTPLPTGIFTIGKNAGGVTPLQMNSLYYPSIWNGPHPLQEWLFDHSKFWIFGENVFKN